MSPRASELPLGGPQVRQSFLADSFHCCVRTFRSEGSRPPPHYPRRMSHYGFHQGGPGLSSAFAPFSVLRLYGCLQTTPDCPRLPVSRACQFPTHSCSVRAAQHQETAPSFMSCLQVTGTSSTTEENPVLSGIRDRPPKQLWRT